MARRVAHEARLVQVTVLDRFQFTDTEIAEVLRVSDATATADRRLLPERHTPIRSTAKNRFQFFLVIYVELVCRGTVVLAPELTVDSLVLLRHALEHVLRVPETLAHLKGIEAAITTPLVLEPETLPYYNLFCAALKNDPRITAQKAGTAEEFWYDSLAGMYLGEVPVRNSLEEQLLYFVHAYTEKTLQFMRPQWSSKLQRLFREKFEQFLGASFTEGQRDALKRRFGFDGRAPQTYAQIGRGRDIPEQRSRELVRAGLYKVRNYCTIVEKEWFAPFLMSADETLEAAIHLVEARWSDEVAFRERLADIEALGEHGLTPKQIAFLSKSPAATEGIPVRLQNLVTNMGTWRDVIRKTDQEFLGTPFWGRKMLDQLHAVLAREGLRTGMNV